MKLFVWDLHGTLEQGNEDAVLELSNQILEKFGYSERFDEVTNKSLYGLKWYQYFEHLLPDASHEEHIALQEASFDLSNSSEGVAIIAKYIRPSRNAKKVLAKIAEVHEQIVISNTVPESLPMFIKALGLERYFGGPRAIAVNQHARDAKRTKVDALREFLDGQTFDEVIVIGDSGGDMELADATNGKGYLYAHDGLEFRSDKGHHKINNLADILVEV